MKTLLAWTGFCLALGLFVACANAADATSAFQPVTCEGTYRHHLQGVCTDEKEAIFWSFTTQLVKTDRQGKVLRKIEVGNHHGDLCYRDGKVYVAVNFGKFNDAQGNANSWIYVYDAASLDLVAKHEVQQVAHGAGGIAWHDGRFLVVGGLPVGAEANLVYEFDDKFTLVKEHKLAGGFTLMGIQTAAFADGRWWFGCYGKPESLLIADADIGKVERYEFSCSLGIVPLGGGKFLIGRDRKTADMQHIGSLVLAEADPQRGLRLVK